MVKYIGELENKLYHSGQSRIDTDNEAEKTHELKNIINRELKLD